MKNNINNITPLSPFPSLCRSTVLSPSLCLSTVLSLPPNVSLPFSLFFSVSLPFSLSHSLSMSLYLLFPTPSLCLSTFSLPLPLYVSTFLLPLPLYVSLPFSLPLPLNVSLPSLSHSLSMSLYLLSSSQGAVS